MPFYIKRINLNELKIYFIRVSNGNLYLLTLLYNVRFWYFNTLFAVLKKLPLLNIYENIPQSNLYSTCIKRAILTLFSTSMISRKESRNLWEITRLISSIFHVSKESDYWKISGTIGNKIWKEKVSAIWYLLASNFILFCKMEKSAKTFYSCKMILQCI